MGVERESGRIKRAREVKREEWTTGRRRLMTCEVAAFLDDEQD